MAEIVSIEDRGAAMLDKLRAQRAGSGVEVSDWAAEVDALYVRGGLPRGASTGWSGLDRHLTLGQGRLTLVTGVPGMGKSEFADAMAVNLAEQSNWCFAVFSPENHPVAVHAVKIIEKRARMPFNVGPNPRMSIEEKESAKQWVRANFTFIDSELATVMDIVRTAVRVGRKGERPLGIIIDPWNMLNHHDLSVRMGGISETEYVSHVLSDVTRFLRHEAPFAHVFMVAHPQKMYRGKDGEYPIPSGYDIAGSAHFFNKADNIVCINRNKSEETQDVDVILQKVRFKHEGHAGLVTLKYDKITGRYFEFGGPAIFDPVTRKPETYRDPSGPPREPGEDDA
jgi:twinkle protein